MSASNDPVVVIRNLHFSRGKRIIFHGVNLDIERGKITAIMGPSGSGKTTLLRLIGAQLAPQQGVVRVEGADIHQLKRSAQYSVRQKMGLLFQSAALFTDLTVFENVAFPLREHYPQLPETVLRHLVVMKLQAVGLRGALELMPSQLSGGMNRRVALARSIVTDPSIMMYDEPFTGQDPISMGVLVQLVRLLNDALGMTTIIVSHDVQETIAIADYAYVIAEGRVIGQGTPEALASHPSDWVQQFMQGLPDGPVPFHYPAQNYVEDLLGGLP